MKKLIYVPNERALYGNSLPKRLKELQKLYKALDDVNNGKRDLILGGDKI